MNREQKRQLAVAYIMVREITGFHTDDEKQIIIGNTNYAFRKRGKAWDLIEITVFDDPVEEPIKQRKTKAAGINIKKALALKEDKKTLAEIAAYFHVSVPTLRKALPKKKK